MTALHKAVAEVAGTRPALVLSDAAISGLLLSGFLRNSTRLKDCRIPVEGYPEVEISFKGLSVNPDNFQARLSQVKDDIYAALSPDFDANFSVHLAANPKLEFSQIRIHVRGMTVRISVAAPQLLLELPDYDAVGSIDFATTRQGAFAAGKITEKDLTGIEGAIAFVIPRRIVNSAFATVNSVNLGEHFTALDLRGRWDVILVPGGIAIIPEGGVLIKENVGCPTHDSVPDLDVSVGPHNKIAEGQYSWPIKVGGVPGPAVHRLHDREDGFAALYAPIPIWEARFEKAMPAIDYREINNGFIGYELSFTAGLNYAGLRLDPARFGIVVDFTILLSGAAYLTVDVPCVGRSDLAHVRFSAARSDLSILVGFVVSNEGKLLLQASIDNLNVADLEIIMDLVTRFLVIAGGHDLVTGFILNWLVARVLEHNIRIKIADAIKSEVNAKNFKLLDLETLAQYTQYGRFRDATFSHEPDSLLLGLASLG